MKINFLKDNWLAGIVFACFTLLCLPLISYGADTEYRVGLGIAAAPEFEGSEDYEAVPVPYVSVVWESGRFLNFSGNSMRLNLLSGGMWQFGPVAQYRNKRDDDVDNDTIAKLREVDSAFEAGAFAGIKYTHWDASVQVVSDVSDEHDGLLAKAMAGYSHTAGNLTTRVGISTTWADDDYMETYFSIDADNALRSGLPTFSAGSGLKNVDLELALSFGMTDQWDVMGLFSYARLLGDADDSPIVDREGDENQFMGGILVIYTF